jgi:hypothetical protein
MLAGSFKSPDMELPRRMASNPQLYQKVRSAWSVLALNGTALRVWLCDVTGCCDAMVLVTSLRVPG